MVNERIQQYTTELLFQQEQQECLQEGVAMETVRSPACQPALVDFFYQVQKDGEKEMRYMFVGMEWDKQRVCVCVWGRMRLRKTEVWSNWEVLGKSKEFNCDI